MTTAGSERRRPLLERMTMIMAAFDGAHERLTGGQIVERTGLPRSTTHRILDELVRLGWLRRIRTRYLLGAESVPARATTDHFGLRIAAAPLLQILAARTGLICYLSVRHGPEVVVLDRLGGIGVLDLPVQVGARLPVHTTAAGKAMLATDPPESVDELLPVDLERRTGWSLATRDQLHLDLHRIRSRGGLAVAVEETVPGVGAIAAAFHDPVGGVAALSLATRARSAQPLERFAPLVVAMARRLGTDRAEQVPGGEPTPTIEAALADDPVLSALLNNVHGSDWI